MKINFTFLIFILFGIKGFSQIPDFLGIPNPDTWNKRIENFRDE